MRDERSRASWRLSVRQRGLILMRPIDLGHRAKVPEAFLRVRPRRGSNRPAIGEARSVDSHHSLSLRVGVAALTGGQGGDVASTASWGEESFLGFERPGGSAPAPAGPAFAPGSAFDELVDRVEVHLYPIGVAVLVAYFSWSEGGSGADAGSPPIPSLCELIEDADGEDVLREVPAVIDESFGHWREVQKELEEAMAGDELWAAALGAIASCPGLDSGDGLPAAAEESSPWLHRLWWEEGNARGACFVAGSGSSVLCADPERPERSRSCVDVLALGTALWLFEDIADAECVRKISRVDGSEHLKPKEITREQRWIWETSLVPTVARSVLTSLPTFALYCWQQLDREWEFETVERNLAAKVDVLRAMLVNRESRNRRRRERWAVAALAVLGAASLASAATDLVGQLTGEPVALSAVDGSRWIVLVVIGALSLATVLLLLLRDRSD